MHDVLIPLIPGYQSLDVAGPYEVFCAATFLLRRDGVGGGYALRLAPPRLGR